MFAEVQKALKEAGKGGGLSHINGDALKIKHLYGPSLLPQV